MLMMAMIDPDDLLTWYAGDGDNVSGSKDQIMFLVDFKA
jgi:hypothetical protein